MSAGELHRYQRQGLLAINPAAFGGMFPAVTAPQVLTTRGVALVTIRGPLEQNAGGWCDSYDGILERVEAACSSPASAIVLRINSPGGDVYGLYDTARAIRSKAAAAGKKLIAYVDGEACSAGYALACAASQIYVSDASFVGSIGVLETRVDVSAIDQAQGVRYAITTSGVRKADRHPHVSLSEAELASAQQRVDSLATLFFELVASFRPLDVAAVSALQAEVFHGAAAVSAGLADRVASFDALITLLASGGDPMADDQETETPKAGNLDDARAALEAAAAGDGPDAEVARAALKVLGGNHAPAESDDGEPAAASSDGESEPDGDEVPPPKKSAANGTSVALAAAVQTLSAKVAAFEAREAAAERKALFASRPDLSAELIDSLKSTSTAEVRGILAAIKPTPGASRKAAAVTVVGTRGGNADGEHDAPPSDEATAALDAAFGNGKRVAITRVGNRKTFGVMSREDARAAIDAAGKGGAK